MLVQERLERYILEYRFGETEGYHKPRIGEYHASTLGDPCLRKSYFHFKIPLGEESIKTLKIFEIGRVFHKYIQELFKDAEIEKEVKIPLDGLKIVGRADIFASQEVYELKTCSELPSKPYLQHEWQVEVYLRGLQINKAVIVYIKKENFDMREFEVQKDDERWDAILQKVKTLHRALVGGWLPPPKKDYYCKWCSWKKLCDQIPGAEEEMKKDESVV